MQCLTRFDNFGMGAIVELSTFPYLRRKSAIFKLLMVSWRALKQLTQFDPNLTEADFKHGVSEFVFGVTS